MGSRGEAPPHFPPVLQAASQAFRADPLGSLKIHPITPEPHLSPHWQPGVLTLRSTLAGPPCALCCWGAPLTLDDIKALGKPLALQGPSPRSLSEPHLLNPFCAEWDSCQLGPDVLPVSWD